MSKNIDDNFFKRADAYINLANEQLGSESRGTVSASMMYGVARFNAWVGACDCDSKDEMKAAKQEMVDYFVAEYKRMLEENLDDYINNFDDFIKQ